MQIKFERHDVLQLLGKALGCDLHHSAAKFDPATGELTLCDLSLQDLVTIGGTSSAPSIADAAPPIPPVAKAKTLPPTTIPDPEDFVVLRPSNDNESYDPPPYDPKEGSAAIPQPPVR
jgi:hypothetical protein